MLKLVHMDVGRESALTVAGVKGDQTDVTDTVVHTCGKYEMAFKIKISFTCSDSYWF